MEMLFTRFAKLLKLKYIYPNLHDRKQGKM